MSDSITLSAVNSSSTPLSSPVDRSERRTSSPFDELAQDASLTAKSESRRSALARETRARVKEVYDRARRTIRFERPDETLVVGPSSAHELCGFLPDGCSSGMALSMADAFNAYHEGATSKFGPTVTLDRLHAVFDPSAAMQLVLKSHLERHGWKKRRSSDFQSRSCYEHAYTSPCGSVYLDFQPAGWRGKRNRACHARLSLYRSALNECLPATLTLVAEITRGHCRVGTIGISYLEIAIDYPIPPLMALWWPDGARYTPPAFPDDPVLRGHACNHYFGRRPTQLVLYDSVVKAADHALKRKRIAAAFQNSPHSILAAVPDDARLNRKLPAHLRNHRHVTRLEAKTRIFGSNRAPHGLLKRMTLPFRRGQLILLPAVAPGWLRLFLAARLLHPVVLRDHCRDNRTELALNGAIQQALLVSEKTLPAPSALYGQAEERLQATIDTICKCIDTGYDAMTMQGYDHSGAWNESETSSISA